MKKLLVLGMAAVLCLLTLAGCKSADPNHPYEKEPAPANKTAAVVTVDIA